MGYTDDVQIFIPFDDSLVEMSMGIPLTTADQPTFVPGVFGDAINLSGSTLSLDALNSLSTLFTLGFWLNSVNPGMVTNPNTNATESLKMPLFSKAFFIYNKSTQCTSATWTKFIVWEETQSSGNNTLHITVSGATSATLVSAEYATGIFHHFWIVYNGNNSSLTLYVDTVLSGITTGTVPSSLALSTVAFEINSGVVGSQYNTALNNGILDDVVIFNTDRSDSNDIYRAYMFGASYVADTSVNTDDEIDQAVIFTDSSTIQITSMYGNRGNIYAGRSDGKIQKGTRTLWESRRDFYNADEINFMTVITRSPTDNLTVQNGALNITNAIVRV